MSKNSLLAENKLILLYLVKKMDIPLAVGEISQFILGNSLMDYFSMQQYLAELVEVEYLEKTVDSNVTRYTITDDGDTTLSYFLGHIPEGVKSEVNQFVEENGKRIRSEFSVTATYFPELNNEYLVKCSVYDASGLNLMELSLTVPTREQAKKIVKNWKSNVNVLYSSILYSLVNEEKKEDDDKKL